MVCCTARVGKDELAKAGRLVDHSHVIRDAASEAANFILGLQGQFQAASILEKKLLLRKVVEGILVDRDRDEVVLTLTRLPKIDNPILNAVRGGAVLSSAWPGPGMSLKIPANRQDFTVISIARLEDLRAV